MNATVSDSKLSQPAKTPLDKFVRPSGRTTSFKEVQFSKA